MKLNLKEIKARHEAATEWTKEADPYDFIPHAWAFIAHARTDIPALCKEVERLQHDLKATQSRFETMAELSTDRGVKNEEDKEEVERLRGFIQDWEGHNHDCDYLDEGSPCTACTCGYDKAREQALEQ